MPATHATTVGADFDAPRTPSNFPAVMTLAAIGTVWFAVALIATLRGWFAEAPGSPPVGLFFAVALPVAAFLTAWATSERFRLRVDALDPLVLASVQHWRVIGGVFLAMLVLGQLPATFAIPAGTGDVLIGLTAVLIVRRLVRDPGFVRSRGYRLFHYAGLADFVVAFGSGAVVASLATDGDPMRLIGTAPLALIPGFVVPVFAIVHLAALLQRRDKA